MRRIVLDMKGGLLAAAAGKVFAVEIDKALIPILGDTLKDFPNVQVINEDILKVDIKKLAEEHNNGKPIKVVANLPYYITTPIIMGLFESGFSKIEDAYSDGVIPVSFLNCLEK